MDWLKKLYKCSNKDFGSTQSDQIARFLFQYRITPHTTTDVSPAEMLGRNLRSRLDLLKPNLEQKVAEKQRRQQFKHSRVRQFSVDEKVFVETKAEEKHGCLVIS